MNLRMSAAIVAGRVASWLSKRQGHKGSSLPGMVALKIYSGTLRDLAAQVRKKIIVVSGTNGKTTTSNMIFGILRDAGYQNIANLEGANMVSGVTTSFVKRAGLSGKIDCDYAVLEVDEATMPIVLKELTPGVVVLTNFFRDQLDRYWELDKVIGVIRKSLKNNDRNTTLILNADDPLVAQFEKNAGLPVVFYGLSGSERSASTSTQTREAQYCPFCGSPLGYEFYHYGQLGRYRCSGCDFARPVARVEAGEPRIRDGVANCRLYFDQQEAELTMQVQGLYNLYNAMAAFAVGLHFGVDVPLMLESLRKYRPVLGRLERFSYQGRSAFLSLVKNPTGFNEGLADLRSMKGTKSLFFAINDNDADGRDISWLWDVDFEVLNKDHNDLAGFICSGSRGEEIALRLKYAGIPMDRIVVCKDMERGIRSVLDSRSDMVYLFSTYTALWPVHKILNSLVDKEGAYAAGGPFIS
ncbi:MAG: MurT ligase domain-containing protein [Desulfotomaculaceae bacterium]|nr:MurT ligase domain-containing protein [Desulfotomaculaceae bacterium]